MGKSHRVKKARVDKRRENDLFRARDTFKPVPDEKDVVAVGSVAYSRKCYWPDIFMQLPFIPVPPKCQHFIHPRGGYCGINPLARISYFPKCSPGH